MNLYSTNMKHVGRVLLSLTTSESQEDRDIQSQIYLKKLIKFKNPVRKEIFHWILSLKKKRKHSSKLMKKQQTASHVIFWSAS